MLLSTRRSHPPSLLFLFGVSVAHARHNYRPRYCVVFLRPHFSYSKMHVL